MRGRVEAWPLPLLDSENELLQSESLVILVKPIKSREMDGASKTLCLRLNNLKLKNIVLFLSVVALH